MKKAAKVIYAVTSNRVLIISPKFFGGVNTRSFSPNMLNEIKHINLADGAGDLIFAYDDRDDSIVRPIGFLGIPDVQNIERIIIKMRDENLNAKNS